MRRLGEAGIHAGSADFVFYILVRIRCDGDDRDGEGIDAGKGADGLRGLEAVHTGHDEIHQDGVEGVEIRFLKSTDGCLAAAHCGCRGTGVFQRGDEDFLAQSIVIDHQHMEAADAVFSGVCDARRQRGFLLGKMIFDERLQLILVGEKCINIGGLPSGILAIEVHDERKNEKGECVADIEDLVAMVHSRKGAVHGIVLHPLRLQLLEGAIVGHLTEIVIDLIAKADIVFTDAEGGIAAEEHESGLEIEMVFLDDILRDSSMADAVVHIAAFDSGQNGCVRGVFDVGAVEIIRCHQDGVGHDSDPFPRELAHMADRLFAKDLHAVGTGREGLDDALHIRVDFQACEHIDLTIREHFPAGRPVACDELRLALHAICQIIEDLYIHARELAFFVQEGMRREITRDSYAKRTAVRTHQGRCIHSDRLSEEPHLPPGEEEGNQDAEEEDYIENQVESIEIFLWLLHEEILSKIARQKESFFDITI